jgi:hypothetical protein
MYLLPCCCCCCCLCTRCEDRLAVGQSARLHSRCTGGNNMMTVLVKYLPLASFSRMSALPNTDHRQDCRLLYGYLVGGVDADEVPLSHAHLP